MLSIIIPAFNEASVISDCLQSVCDQSFSGRLDIIVAANGCQDTTVSVAESFADAFKRRGYRYRVLNIVRGNKANALNRADEVAEYASRMYLDADVTCSSDLANQVCQVLSLERPVYASGTLELYQNESLVTRAYAKIWRETPYVRMNVPGCGCYAVNGEGRARWGRFPDIHSDDKFVRLLFPEEWRCQVKAKYSWPLPQGFITLLNVRTRWIRGNIQLARTYPHLSVNDSARMVLDSTFIRVLLTHPVASAIFFSIYFLAAVRAYLIPQEKSVEWSRAR